MDFVTVLAQTRDYDLEGSQAGNDLKSITCREDLHNVLNGISFCAAELRHDEAMAKVGTCNYVPSELRLARGAGEVVAGRLYAGADLGAACEFVEYGTKSNLGACVRIRTD